MKALRVLSLIGLLTLTTVPLFVHLSLTDNHTSTICGDDPLPPPPPWEPAGSLLIAS
jgi:hypothetical protein